MSVPPRPDNGTEWVYMNSDRVYLNATEISHLSDRDARIALYEMYARYKWSFIDDEMSAYFKSLSWYEEGVRESSQDPAFNDIEKWNVDLLKKEADKRRLVKPGDIQENATVQRPAQRPAHPGITRPTNPTSPVRPTGRR